MHAMHICLLTPMFVACSSYVLVLQATNAGVICTVTR